MKPVVIVLIIIAVLVVIGIVIKLATRNQSSENLGDSRSFWDKVKDACCLKKRV